MTSTDKSPREFYVGSHLIIVDDEMIPILSKFTWHIQKNKQTFYAYTNVKIGGRATSLSMHRLLTGMTSGIVDHKNRNGLDNRLENLRFATKRQNSYNRARKNKTGFRGVYRHRDKFACQIQAGEVRIDKTGFNTAEEAARMYDKLSKELHGEFGIRNFKD